MSTPAAMIVPRQEEERQVLSRRTLAGAILGPLVALSLWFAPLGMERPAQHTLAIVLFLIVYWVTEPVTYGVTALIGCFLFWALGIAKFDLAFSGFADNTPWFLYGAMLMGQAVSRTGLARRIGYLVMRLIGSSYSRLLLSLIIFVFILNFLVPSGLAQLFIIAPIAIGIISAFDLEPNSNIGRGLFVILTYCCGLFNKMILAGGASILTQGVVEKVTGQTIYWSQYFIAFLPVDVISIVACWAVTLWLFPPEKKDLPGGTRFLRDALNRMGRWSSDEKKTLVWLLLAIGLWSTDKLHHIHPAVIAIGVGLVLTLPKVGVLSTRDIRKINFLLIIFIGGALSMGEVMIHTKAVDVLTRVMLGWMTPLMKGSLLSSSVLYWAGFFYHFALATELSMLSTSLPVIVHFAATHGFNPIAFAMLWNFATGGKIFVYQSAVLALGYSYGYFEGKDLIRIGLVLTIIEGLILLLLVPIYWPLIGLQWKL